MIDIKLSRGITETLEILKYMDKMYTEKIPKKFMDFLKDNKDTSYTPKFDCTENLQDRDILRETKILLGIMYLKYWNDEASKKEYLQTLDENQKKYHEEINKKYNPDNLFKKDDKNIEKKLEENVQIIEYKESVFQKIVKKIKLFLRRK